MKKSDLLQQIQEIKSRSGFNSMYDYSSRLNDIESALDELNSFKGNFNNELLKYVPIATIACFEAFFRIAIKEMWLSLINQRM
jgi:hypothetical protein